ncbi:response regulator transcription factor [Litchfieldia salsa]|uniref:Two-component system, response regulator YesN n=1 Tax=Litchfieldia salsa TaxID=930152 RepID=A0A1H0PZS0_9BACI|nr:helix-turn-helix domain-containing protein [Litchfieldia salsa]SDP09996.1 two-component system, response regulator YesN [Litchfieldia salsa]
MHKKVRTIIVDDEARLRRGIERLVLFNNEDFEVVATFGTGKQCLEAIYESSIQFDLLITDIKMPEMDGLTLIKELKKIMNFHSIVISGFDDFHFLQTAIREGASDYLIKPIDREEFKSQIHKIRDKIISDWNHSRYLEDIQEKVSRLPYVQQLQMLSEITLRQEVDLSQLEWTKDFPKGQYQLLYVCVDHLVSSKTKAFQKEDWDAWIFAFDNISNELMNKTTNNTWKWKGDGLSYWMLFNQLDEGGSTTIINQFADELKQSIGRYTPFTCSIAISEKITDLALLSSVKDELLTYMKYRLVYGGNKIYSSSKVHKLKTGHEERTSSEIELKIDKVIFSLDRLNQEQVRKEIRNFLDSVESLSSPTDITHSLHLLGIRLINYVVKDTSSKNDLTLINELFELTNKLMTLNELKVAVYEWVNKVLKIIKNKNNIQPTDTVDLGKKWIGENLDKNITIQKIAFQVHMNPTYFSEYFKSQTGETILDYVTRMRIEKAKELLLSTDLKIYDISIEVGYTDTKYFSKLFKKYYGEVPSKFRDRLLFEQN